MISISRDGRLLLNVLLFGSTLASRRGSHRQSLSAFGEHCRLAAAPLATILIGGRLASAAVAYGFPA